MLFVTLPLWLTRTASLGDLAGSAPSPKSPTLTSTLSCRSYRHAPRECNDQCVPGETVCSELAREI